MDSDNSGSLQSSSGGDEEFDSRAESLSPFFTPTAAGHMGSVTNHPLPTHPSQNHHNSSMFDPLSNFFDPLSRPSPNLDTIWSTKNARSEINPILTSVQPFFGSSPLTVPFPLLADNTSTPRAPSSSSTTTDHHQAALGVARNPKKRSRASRRAPTTVLTTDTTNFRAMVQEFTGIPAPPFTSSSPFPRTRLDLFGTPSSARSNPLDASQPPPYLLRPFAQKFQPPPLVSSSSSPASSFLSSSIVNGTNNITSVTASTGTASNLAPPINFQLPSDHNHQLGLLKDQPQQGLLNMQQNPILTFQSLLQSADPKYPLPNPSILGSKSPHPLEIPSNNNHLHLKMGVLDEFGLTHNTHLTALPNLVSSDRTAAATRNDDNPASWAGGGVGSDNNTDQAHLMMRSVNGNYDRRPENVPAARGGGEGMVESWIRSSD